MWNIFVSVDSSSFFFFFLRKFYDFKPVDFQLEHVVYDNMKIYLAIHYSVLCGIHDV